MELLAVIVFLTGLLCSNARSLPAVLSANCSEVEKDAGVALDLINKHRRDGFIFALFRVADAHVQRDGNASILYLTLDVLETECSVLTGKYWDSCGHRKFYSFTDFGQCKAVMYVDKLAKRNELYGYNCTLTPVPPRVYECRDCPVRTTVLEDAERYAGDAEIILERFRKESNETNYFKLEKVQKVFSAVGDRTVYLIEFTIKETKCPRGVDPASMPECEFLPNRYAYTGFCIGRVVHGSEDPDGVELESCDIFDSDYDDSKEHHHRCNVSGYECRCPHSGPSHRHSHHHHVHHYPHHHPPHHGHHVPRYRPHHHHHHHNDSGEHHHHCNVSEHECRHPHPGPPHRHHHHRHHGHHNHHHPHHHERYHHHHHHPHHHHHGHRNGHECPTPPEHYHHNHDQHGSAGPTGHHNSSEESQEQHPGPPGPHYPSPPAGGPHHFPPNKYPPPPVGPPPPPDRPHGIPLPPSPCCPPPPPPPSRLDRKHGQHHHPKCNSTSEKRGKGDSTECHDSFQDHHSFHHREIGSVYYIPVLGEHDVLQLPAANFPENPHSPHGGHEEPPLPKKNKLKQQAVQPFPSTPSESKSCPAKPIYDLPKILSLYSSQPAH